MGETKTWTQDTIRLAFENFITEHGRLPSRYEIQNTYKNLFPKPIEFKKITGKTRKIYLKEYPVTQTEHCRAIRYNEKTKEEWVEYFREKYHDFGMPTEEEYNKMRRNGEPGTKTLKKKIGVTTWGELLEHCGLIEEKATHLSGGIEFEFTLENCKKLHELLQSALIKK